MATTITDEIFVAYSQCPRKAYLLMYSKESGQIHEYQQILDQNRLTNQRRHLDILDKNESNVYPYTVNNLKNSHGFLTNAKLFTGRFQASCPILTRVKRQIYEPTIFVGTHTINGTDKLCLRFVGNILAKVQGRPPAVGHIIRMDSKSNQVKLQENNKRLVPLLEQLQQWAVAESTPKKPPVILNKHCPMCQFRQQCQAIAVQEDNLSRLHKIMPRMIRMYERKGIFTVKQLSYLFKPRKRKKRAKNPPPTVHKVELQALAIRTGKIFLQELPTLTRGETELFLDFESVPDQSFHYLIGLLVCQGESAIYYPFWAKEAEEEATIWQEFLLLINQYPAAPIYHYGSYEPRTVAKLARQYDTDGESLTKRMVNVNKQIYGKVYFPVYSNQLKEVAGFVGATWTSPNASGLHSLVWRHRWDETSEDRYKDTLLTYNEEDCRALKVLVEKLFKIQQSAATLSKVDFADQYKQRTTGVSEQVSNQFKNILKLAHFNYDHNKIHFRQEDENKESKQDKLEIRKLASKRYHEKLLDVKRKIKKIIQIEPDKECPHCGYGPLTPTKYISRRFIVDLLVTKSGIRKNLAQYEGIKGYCRNCTKISAPAKIRRYSKNQIYGHGFGAWVVYQRIALRLPYESIVESAWEQFGEKFAVSQPQEFLKRFARYYAECEKKIAKNLYK